MKEALIVMWRFNPAGVAAYLCGQLFENINDATPSDQKAAMVAETLGSIEILPVETYEEQFSTTIAEVCNGISGATIKSAVKAYPQIEDFLRESVGNQDAGLTDSFTRLTRAAVTKQRPHYQQLVTYFNQLQEGLPRYTSVMTRTGFLDGIIGFAAGFFGGYLGAAGAQAWDNWRGSSDQEFCQKFGAAFDEFAQACHAYTTNGESSLSLVFDRLIDEVRRLDQQIFDCYDELAKAGWDIQPLYHNYRTPDPDDPLDDDAKEFFDIAISNLEENRSVHYRSIENIRQILGMSTSPASPVAVPKSPPPPPPNQSQQRSVPPPLPHG